MTILKPNKIATVPVRTSGLLSLIFKAVSPKQFLEKNEVHLRVPTFSEYISELCKQRGEAPERIIKRTTLERSFGHQLFTGRRNPSRDTVIMLAFGFEADLDVAQELLKIAGFSALYPRGKRDAMLIYCLHHNMSVDEAQIMLHDLNLPILGGIRQCQT